MSKTTKRKLRTPEAIIGWREWVRLPELGIRFVKAKVDTGARSSSLHAFDVETFIRDRREFVRFKVHPNQRDESRTIETEAPVLESRDIRSSNGQITKRLVIVTTVTLMGKSWPVDLTLANRDEMGFRMLLGREAVRGRFLIDAGRSYSSGVPKKKPRRQKKRGKRIKRKTKT